MGKQTLPTAENGISRELQPLLDTLCAAEDYAVLVYDTKMNVQMANPIFQTTYGFDPVGLNAREIIRRVFCRRLDGRLLELDDQPALRALRGERVKGVQHRVIRRDGAEIIVETSSGPIYSGDCITGALTIWHDISEQMRSEEALRQSEEQYRRLFENVNDLVCEVDAQARYLFVNSRYEEILGYAPEELLGKYVRELIHPDDLRLSSPEFKKLVDGRTISRNEWRFKHKNGEWRWFDCVAQTYEKSPGDVRIVTVSRDVTERKSSEEMLRLRTEELEAARQELANANARLEQRVHERTEQLQAINAEMKVEIAERARAEDTIRQQAARAETLADLSRRLAAASLDLQTTFQVITRSAAEHVGDTCALYILSEDAQWLKLAAIYNPDQNRQERLYQTVTNLPLRVGENVTDLVTEDGGPLCLSGVTAQQLAAMTGPDYLPVIEELKVSHVLVVPLRQEGRTFGALALIRGTPDLPYSAEDQELMEALTDRAVLSISKARLYQDLQDSLQRELQTRLQLIQAEKNTALARMVASIAHEINNPIQTIKNCTYLLRELVDPASDGTEILNMASAEANRIGDLVARLREIYKPSKEIIPKPFNVLDVLYQVHTLLLPHLQHHNVRWAIRADVDCVLVNGIADQLKQVFLNICLNAIDAIDQDAGKILVRVSRPKDSRACISISDNGKGIDSEDIAHIFEPFYTTKEKGSGLGLAICNEIVKNFNGDITVESQPGVGSVFNIWLPVL